MSPRGRHMLVAAGAAVSLGLAGCASATTASTAARPPGTLVIDTVFDLESADPARQVGATAALIGKAVYETLLTFAAGDLTTPVDGLARYSFSADATRMVLTIKPGHRFPDGTAVTAADVVFSLNRVKGINAPPAALLAGVSVAKTSATSVTLTCKEPTPGLPFLLASPALGIVSETLVRAKGGTTDRADTAAEALTSASAGSGAYQVDSAQPGHHVTLVRNPRYGGPKPAFDRVLLRNVPPQTQQLNIQGGDSAIALNLSPTQASALTAANVTITRSASPTVVFLLLNQRPGISRWTANSDIVAAVRAGLDHQRFLELAGPGAVQPGGIISTGMLGALPANPPRARDVPTAKAAVAAAGYRGTALRLSYPNDVAVNGLPLARLAPVIRDQLAEIGLKITLAPAPLATALGSYRAGREQLGLWYWTPDVADPSGYLGFAPGGLIGLRANWTPGERPAVDAAANAARAATGARRAAAWQTFQRELNRSGPFIPLLQPARNIASSTALTQLALHPIWTLDVARVR